MKFKKGDIVYFKEEYKSKYIFGEYFHKINKPYKITIMGRLWNWDFTKKSKKSRLIEEIKSLHDNQYHPVDKKMNDYLIPETEWKQRNREIIINSILNDK
jgi:hypothetical protein